MVLLGVGLLFVGLIGIGYSLLQSRTGSLPIAWPITFVVGLGILLVELRGSLK